LQAARAGRLDDSWVPEEFLRTQRQAIAGRVAGIGSRDRAWWRAPAWVAVMVAAGVALSWPEPAREKLVAGGSGAASESGMYLAIYQTIATEEPRALAPMHALFEEQ
jgi:hypothetical protein